jgi:hypothetical protein
MSMTRQRAGRAGSADRARRNWRPLAAAAAVLVVGLGITIPLAGPRR